MKLLVVTQTVDRAHPVLGFFHRWLEELASRFESIEVICLGEGEHTLPANVRVHSLGKEKDGNRLLYIIRFLRLVRTLSYDLVFVHMNPEYVLLAGSYWRSHGKKVSLWYNHEKGDWRLALAARQIDRMFHTSPYAASARFAHAMRMPAGIDTALFSSHPVVRTPHSVYFQGRVAPAKRVHVLLEAVRMLKAQGVEAHVSIVGPEEAQYGKQLRAQYSDLADSVAFLGPRRNEDTPELYRSHVVSVNLTAAGNYDKTVLESLACGTPAVVSSKAFAGIVPEEWIVPEEDASALANKLRELFMLSPTAYAELSTQGRERVVASESLPMLSERLFEALRALAQ